MSLADRKIWTAKGFKRASIQAERAERVSMGATKKVSSSIGKTSGAGRWNQGVTHPVSQRPVGGQLMSARDTKLFKQDGTTRKGVGPSAVKAAYGLPGGKKLATSAKRSTVKRKPAKRKTAAKRVVRKGKRRYRVGSYTRASGKQVKSYLRSRPGTKRKVASKKSKAGTVWVKGYTRSDGVKVKGHHMRLAKKKAAPKRRRSIKVKSYKRKIATKRRRIAANPTRRPSAGAVWVKGYTRSDKVKVKGHWMKPATGKKRKRVAKKVARKSTRRISSYLRKVPGRSRRTRVASYTRKRRAAPKRAATKRRAAPKRGRTRRVSSYLRKVPGRSRRIRVGGYTKKLPSRTRRSAPARRKSTAKRSTVGKVVRRKGYTRSDGTRVKATSYRLKKGGARKGRITRNPSRVRAYSRNSLGRRPTAIALRRNSLGMRRNGGRLGMLSNVERSMLANRMRRNQSTGLMALLPASEQLKIIGTKVGVGALGFGGAVAMGVALNRVSALTQYLGTWTPVLGNVAAGLAYWALASAMDDERLKEMRIPVAVGAGFAAVFNIANNLVARQTIPSNIASWILPGAGAVAAAPTEMVEPTNGNGNATVTAGDGTAGFRGFRGFGQIDVYEAALDGFGGIEEELEMELNRMGGMRGVQGMQGMGDGIFDTSPDGIFDGMSGAGEYISVPLSGMGAQVEEAFAGGTGEYMSVPLGGMGGMGAQVEQAFAGTQYAYGSAPGRSSRLGEYLEVPLGGMGEYGEYLSVPMGGMGAQVEQAYAGMGQDDGATAAQVEQSLQNNPLMPGFREAVQQMVRKRIAAGQPLDEAFYAKVGSAASSLARRKFDQRVAQVGGNPQDIATEPWKAPLLRSSAPTYMRPVGDPRMIPGNAGQIASQGSSGNQGIFSDTDDDGIF